MRLNLICKKILMYILILTESFFITLSVKHTSILYAPRENFIYSDFFDTYTVFPLEIFDYFLWLGIFVLLLFLIKFAARIIKINNLTNKISVKYYICLTIFIFLAWLPYFFAFYPATSMEDEIFAMRNPFEVSNQPLLYNYLLNFIWNFGIYFNDELLGFAVFTLLKMLFMAFAISYLLCFIYKRGISIYLICFFLVFFAFFPIFPNYAVSLVKDTLFSVFILFFTLFLYEYKDNCKLLVSSQKVTLTFLFLALPIIYLRSNGIYIIVATLFVIGFLCKVCRKKFILLTIFLIFLNALPNINRTVPFRETIGVPLQQIGRIIANNGDIDKQDMTVFDNVFKISLFKEKYMAFNSDEYKYAAEFNDEYLNQHKSDFLLSWIKTVFKNPSVCFTAHALLTYDYWALSPWLGNEYNQTVFAVAISPEILNADEPERFSMNYGLKTSESDFLPAKVKEKVGQFMFDNVFFVTTGVCGFVLVFVTGILFCQNKTDRILSLLPVLFAWLTLLLAAPRASVFRYAFYFALLMPFILSVTFFADEEN
ncbi:MAG: hypothetical protein IKN43_10830 [Selenomonadaceae bacterium]|nr:hypothetical protein [Selenomonadaceae bacterium]